MGHPSYRADTGDLLHFLLVPCTLRPRPEPNMTSCHNNWFAGKEVALNVDEEEDAPSRGPEPLWRPVLDLCIDQVSVACHKAPRNGVSVCNEVTGEL